MIRLSLLLTREKRNSSQMSFPSPFPCTPFYALQQLNYGKTTTTVSKILVYAIGMHLIIQNLFCVSQQEKAKLQLFKIKNELRCQRQGKRCATISRSPKTHHVNVLSCYIFRGDSRSRNISYIIGLKKAVCNFL